MNLAFSTKGGTLELLSGRIEKARIAPLVRFKVVDWRNELSGCLAKVATLGSGPWIVRSSCHREDSDKGSNAGAFLSVGDVSAPDLSKEIEKVIASYGVTRDDDEVLVQPMLQNVLRSGVAFSHDPNTCAPYRVINWMEGADTAAVTGGLGGRTWQCAAMATTPPPANLSCVIAMLEELLELFGGSPIDCEFAVTGGADVEVLWLLQVRRLLLSRTPDTPARQTKRLQIIADRIVRGDRSHPFLMGRKTVYGVMPDWNPAEIIGIRPKPLALSLYRELVTDNIWAYQRNNYGYRNLRSFPLMPHFFGLPYIDVRLSFNSFIPADLDSGLASRLADYYVDRLTSDPMLHDKVEFEIVFSCYTFDITDRISRLSQSNFTSDEIGQLKESLRRLTNRIIHPKDGLWKADAARLDVLRDRREQLLASGLDKLERIYWLIEDGKRYGTLPFAGLARAGFIAVQLLRSLLNVGIFSQADYDAFMSSISTVSSWLTRDRTTMDKGAFLYKYGHLRPGTYDILSPRYDESPDIYFDWNCKPEVRDTQQKFSLTLCQMRDIEQLLEAHGLYPGAVALFDFLQAGIELREFSKFEFSKNLSDVLSLAAAVADDFGIAKEDMAFCDFNAIKELYVGTMDPVDTLVRSIDQGKARYQDTLFTSLPPLITNQEDVWAFEWPEMMANFITQKNVTAAVVQCNDRQCLAGAIVCIPNADPGYDWLFAHPIAGLITAWGGVNSHMAIRAGELGLPAVIGAGESQYHRWASAKRLHVDCAGRRVEVLA